jgi:hypothetical protein
MSQDLTFASSNLVLFKYLDPVMKSGRKTNQTLNRIRVQKLGALGVREKGGAAARREARNDACFNLEAWSLTKATTTTTSARRCLQLTAIKTLTLK